MSAWSIRFSGDELVYLRQERNRNTPAVSLSRPMFERLHDLAETHMELVRDAEVRKDLPIIKPVLGRDAEPLNWEVLLEPLPVNGELRHAWVSRVRAAASVMDALASYLENEEYRIILLERLSEGT